jgi:hypothetical protein
MKMIGKTASAMSGCIPDILVGFHRAAIRLLPSGTPQLLSAA